MISHRCKRFIFQTLQNPLNLQKTHLFASISSSSKEEILDLLQKHNLSSINASKIASALSPSKNVVLGGDSMLTFLKDAGFSAPQLEKMLLRKPKLLTSNLDSKIKPKVQAFQALGFSSSDIAVMLSARPETFDQSLTNRIVPSILTLKMVFGSDDEVSKVLKLYPGILGYDLKKTMLPNIDYLKSCGIGTDQLVTFANSVPRFLVMRPENMKRFVEKAEQMGCSRHSKMFVYGVRTLSSMSEDSFKKKLDLFRELGFSQEHILVAFQKQPLVFAVSSGKIRKVVKVVLDNKIYNIFDVICYPDVFMRSVEKTIEPRLRVLDILLRRNLLKRPPAFSATYSNPNQRFFNRYIVPYLGKVDEFRRFDDWNKEFSELDRVCS